ncbi:MAG TPA: hypothetical protein VGK20_09780 [Candidatus Binatia bacterium]|jgi:pimeloyl-ACP methyl ester carboxylesterase
MNRFRCSGILAATALAYALLVGATAANAADKCRAGDSGPSDSTSIAELRAAIARLCPCASFDGSDDTKDHKAFAACAQTQIGLASGGTPVMGFTIRSQCKSELKKLYAKSNCGYAVADPHVMCCSVKTSSGKTSGAAATVDKCVDSANGSTLRHSCDASPFSADACSFDASNSCKTTPVVQETVDLASPAHPANTPGSPAVVVSNPKLLAQFGGGSFTLNNTRYTRHHLADAVGPPDAILVLVPGFEGGAGNFRILAQNLIERAVGAGFTLEVWAYDRRTNKLEDLEGADLAEEFSSPLVALDWFFGGELGLTLHPVLAAGPNRRAQFYDTQADVPFIANWTPLVFARDIDVIVSAASAAATNHNVFLGGHSMGTLFTARYASTDFNLSGVGPADPGYAKVRGLVLLEGGGGNTLGAPLTADSLDRIVAKYDGGLFGAVRDNAPRCVDGSTACTVATEATDCAGQVPPKCTPPTTSYSIVPGLLNARVLSAGEVTAIQAVTDPNRGAGILAVDQGAVGNNAVAKVPDLSGLSILGKSSAFAGIGGFVDDDGVVASFAPFVACSVGGPGVAIHGVKTWIDITGVLDASLTPNNGPAPTSLPASDWGQEKEVTRIDRLIGNFYVGQTNFTDTYFPGSGLSVTSASGVCTSGVCSAGNVGAACSADANCNQSISIDSSALSITRGRRDIENLTQAANINVPVIAFGGTNGLAPAPGVYTPFAQSIGPCTAPSCDGTARVIDASSPNPAFPTFGDIHGGFEVYMAEGFAHLDIVTAEDNADNPVPEKLVAFLKRNLQ